MFDNLLVIRLFQTVEECRGHSGVWNRFYTALHNNVRNWLVSFFVVWIAVAEHDIRFIYFPDEDNRDSSRNFCFFRCSTTWYGYHPEKLILNSVAANIHRWGRDFPPVQTGPGAHPASCTMGTGTFPGVKCGQDVLLTTHPLLVPRSWKSRVIPLPTLWVTPDL